MGASLGLHLGRPPCRPWGWGSHGTFCVRVLRACPAHQATGSHLAGRQTGSARRALPTGLWLVRGQLRLCLGGLWDGHAWPTVTCHLPARGWVCSREVGGRPPSTCVCSGRLPHPRPGPCLPGGLCAYSRGGSARSSFFASSWHRQLPPPAASQPCMGLAGPWALAPLGLGVLTHKVRLVGATGPAQGASICCLPAGLMARTRCPLGPGSPRTPPCSQEAPI